MVSFFTSQVTVTFFCTASREMKPICFGVAGASAAPAAPCPIDPEETDNAVG